MIHLRNKGDVLFHVEKHCKRGAIVRALQEGTVEFCGGFSQIPPRNKPGWIVRVTSRFDRVWNVAVMAEKTLPITVVGKIPWGNWVGEHNRNELYRGDNPDEYIGLKNDLQ